MSKQGKSEAPREISLRDKVIELEREVAFRHRVYRRLVSQNKMKLSDAQFRIRVMTEILDDYKSAEQMPLFGGGR